MPVRHSTHPTIPSTTSTAVAYARRSGAIPGISLRRRRPSSGAGVRRGLGSAGRWSRSSFGARLRRRLPQYGHSVMYGLTSEPQFLQTTNRSWPPVLTKRL